MKTRILSFMASAVAVVALLTGCSTENDIENGKDGLASLELSSVSSSDMLTRAVIDGTTFPTDKGNIGLFLFKDELAETPYGESGYANVKYSYDSGKKKWTASPSIKVGSTQGYLYGYYPYKAGTQQQPVNIKDIQVASSFNGDDVMYATPQDPITDQTAGNVSVTMKHALARVAITVVNKGYTGDAKLQSIKFAGAEIAESGTLNALDGTITATKAEAVTLIVPEASQAIATGSGSVYECLLVPSAVKEGRQNVTLTLKIDGQEKSASLTDGNGVIFGSGVKSRIVINLSNSGISVASVSIDDWQTVEVGGHKVTVKLSEDAGIVKDVMVTAYIENKNVVVKTYSDSKKPLIIREEDGKLLAPVEEGNKSTFTFSDVTEDITATLAYAKTFKVTQSFKADVTPVSGYFENYPAQGLGEVLEGRTAEVTVATNIPGYHFEKIVCDEMVETGGTIVLKNVSKNFEVIANYKFYDYPLPGVFTVADDEAGNVRKVQFARGNLWYQKGVFHNENEQYAFSSSDWEEDGHISHFMWCKSASESVKMRYDEQGAPSSDNLFTNAGPTEPNGNFAVNGQKGFWRALSGGGNGEWKYLIGRKDSEGNALCKFGVTVCDCRRCLILLPDDWKWGENGVGSDWYSEYNESTTVKWSTMEAAGAVCLPAASYRNCKRGEPHNEKVNLDVVGIRGYYWSSTPTGSSKACDLHFDSSNVNPATSTDRFYAYAVRLVTEVK